MRIAVLSFDEAKEEVNIGDKDFFASFCDRLIEREPFVLLKSKNYKCGDLKSYFDGYNEWMGEPRLEVVELEGALLLQRAGQSLILPKKMEKVLSSLSR